MSLLKNTSIRVILLITLGFFLILWGGVSAFTLSSLNQVTQFLATSEEQKSDIDIISRGNDQYFRTVTRLARAMDFVQTGQAADADKIMASAVDSFQGARDALASFKASQHTASDPAVTKAMIDKWTALIDQALDPMFRAAQAKQMDQFRQLFRTQYPPFSVAFGAAAENFKQQTRSDASVKQVYSLVDLSRKSLIGALIAGVVILLLTDRYLINFMIKPLGRIASQLETLSEGHLGEAIAEFGRNNVGQLIPHLQNMQQSLIRTVTAIRDSSASIYQGSGEISLGNSDLSSRTEQQASALEETAASMEQLSATVKQNTENVFQANKMVQDASDTAKKGGAIVDEVVETMSSISTSSKKIADITGVINGIAFQTNILALNAAVEAARAGEQGRGFAVVAGEVRSLAQRSAQAAKEIEGLIAESVERVNTGSVQASRAGETMHNVVKAVTKVTDLMGEISSASDEQSRGISQVGQAVSEMDSVTQQNAALVQESAAAAASLEEQARLLTETVAIFHLPAGEKSVNSALPSGDKLEKTLLSPLTASPGREHSTENWETF
ncbi:methyl-accepting chemotaxis protein [Sodalis sp. dw_96]|uniref:methyl-accepting chemotaxis protein n=1 Tax=Sodalis sp. dw_96 TaxID=2719794 RepID=UPI001BD6D8F4|nr:methyl-accepting chemotaxis protein [Sodalis sp. dw_96]